MFLFSPNGASQEKRAEGYFSASDRGSFFDAAHRRYQINGSNQIMKWNHNPFSS